MQKTDVLLGLQWGDEGKGKAVDVIAPNYNIVARFQGGPNAGHTLEIGDTKIVLNTIPSGVFRKENINLIGNGVVIDPCIIQIELDRLATAGLDITETLYISRRAHLILPGHPLIDAAKEKSKGDKKIGSTLKGIGPTYQDKISRAGVRIGDLEKSNFEEIYQAAIDRHNVQLSNYGADPIPQESIDAWRDEAMKLKRFKFVDGESYLLDALNKGNKVLAEGAQGTLLDVEFGSYPFVTSSNTICAGACTGLGLSPKRIGTVYGIFKAYCTRVGSGPFPTELFDDVGAYIAKAGNEFGATTGRPRRCGWLDLPTLKFAVNINGVDELIMTKADVLSGLDEIKVCTKYKNSEYDISLPYDLADVECEWKTFKGWDEDLTSIKNIEDLPATFRTYLDFLEEELQTPIKVVSVGPKRSETIFN